MVQCDKSCYAMRNTHCVILLCVMQPVYDLRPYYATHKITVINTNRYTQDKSTDQMLKRKLQAMWEELIMLDELMQ